MGAIYWGKKWGYNRYPIFTFTKLLKHFGPVDLSYEVQLYVQAIIWNKLIHPDHLEQYTHPNDHLSKFSIMKLIFLEIIINVFARKKKCKN